YELYKNGVVLNDPRFKVESPESARLSVYPRLYYTGMETALSSGVFDNRNDARLFKLIHRWLQCAKEFNRRLDVTEFHLFGKPTPENIAAFRGKSLSGQVGIDMRRAFLNLLDCLTTKYAKESGIRHDTKLFDEDEPAQISPVS